MMPLSFLKPNESCVIRRIGGTEEVRRFLGTLGFASGGTVTVVNQMNGNVIVNVKDSRVAVSREMAAKILVQTEEQKNGNIKRSEDR